MVERAEWVQQMAAREAEPYAIKIGEVVLYAALLETLVSELVSLILLKVADRNSMSLMYHIGFAAKCEIIKNLCKSDGHEVLVPLRKLMESAEKFNGFRNIVVHGGTAITPEGIRIHPLSTAKQFSKSINQKPISLQDMRDQIKAIKPVALKLQEYVETFREDDAADEPQHL